MLGNGLPQVEEVDEIVRVAEIVAARGWAEATAGNISVRLQEVPGTMRDRRGLRSRELGFDAPELSGAHFLFTGAGSRMREIPWSPGASLVIVELTKDGRSCKVLWGEAEVSSEFRAHLAVHRALVGVAPEFRAVLHAHPPALLAASHAEAFRRGERAVEALFGALPEARFLIPEGFGVVRSLPPGSLELALATGRVFEDKRIALWEKHGVISSGSTLSQALDRIEVLEKAAEVYLKLLCAGLDPAAGSGDTSGTH